MAAEWLEALRKSLQERQLDLDGVLARIVDETTRQLDADRGTLYLVDHVRGELVSRVAHLPEIAEIRLRLGEGVAGWVADGGELLNVPRGTQDPRFAPRVDHATGYTTHSLLAAPVHNAAGAVVAVFQLLNKRQAVFSAADEALLTELCASVAELLVLSSLGSQLDARQEHPLSFGYNHIVGDSAAMRAVYDRTARAARTDATVLIRGESGAGKELIARAVHDNSKRADQPFVAIDLAALPPQLVENELFGHVRGAFTGADRDQPGKVQAAAGGTLFLDEVADAPPQVQAKLLRLVQEHRYFPVGSATEARADVRFVCATHRDLEAMVAAETFRQDLYYRLRVVEIVVPPLRDRGHADLDRLTDYFLFEARRRHERAGLYLSPAARVRLHGHDWPGNVRELQHCLEAAVVLTPGDLITAHDLEIAGAPGAAVDPAAVADGRFVTDVRPLRAVERAYVRYVLERSDGNLSQAARRLGISRGTLRRKLQEPKSG